MQAQEIILKKRNGQALSRAEITYFINGICSGEIPDYQTAALLMAIWFKRMDNRETTDLTLAMRDSGERIDLSSISGIKVDKHSTGGVADTTSLITIPLVAACGGKVAKISGRGLGHTGGTLDKLESIPGFKVFQSMADFTRIVNSCGCAIIGQTQELVPADKLLYALRSVTGTVDNLSLIASSIMSKKLASGADAIVLDVKTGNGAFLKTPEQATELAQLMVAIGQRAGRQTIALITDMNQPLGNNVGNTLEVKEALDILRGKKEGPLKTVAMALAAEMLVAGQTVESEVEAYTKLQTALSSGRALQNLADMIAFQGGNPNVCSNPSLLPQAAEIIEIPSDKSGFVTDILTIEIGNCAGLLGAGRLTKEDSIDPTVGLCMRIRLGDRVDSGTPLAELHVNTNKNTPAVVERLKAAITIESTPRPQPQLIYARISESGEERL